MLVQEYYTWGGHDAVVSAFNRTALIFSAGDFKSLFAVLATASLAFLVFRIIGGIAFGSKDLHGQNYATGALFPWLLTMAIFTASVIPKGTLHIYDPTENKYQAVGGVPDIIVLFAGTTNKIERALVDLVTTAGDPVGFGKQAGGKGFLGLYEVTTRPLQATDTRLQTSLQNYITDCVYFEATLTPGFVDELRKTSTDLISSLAKAVNPAVSTVIYDAALPANGESMSCTAAWANLQPRLTAPAQYDGALTGICTEMGFDTSAGTGMIDCKDRLTGPVAAQIATGKTSAEFIRSAYVAQSMDAVLSRDGAGEKYANFSILNKASGTMSTINNWLPTIRSVILAVTVALTPFLSLLMLTPAMPKAAKFILGSFAFLTIWGTVDAILHQFIVDYSNKLYGEIRQNNLGLDALRFFPNSTEKVLAMFGLVRASGLALAATIASSVIGLGSSVGAAIGGKIMSEATNTGAQAEGQMLDPAAKAGVRKANQSAIPTETIANEHSWSTRQTAELGQQGGQLQQQLGAVAGAGGMDKYLGMRHGQGVTSSYRGQGDVSLNQAFMQQAEAMGIPREEAQKIAAATVNHGDGLAELRRLQEQGYSGKPAAQAYWQGKTVDHMQGKSVGQQQGFTMYRPAKGQEQGKWGQVQATWQDGFMVGLQGNTVNVASAEQLRANYDKSYSQGISQHYSNAQTLGQSVTRSWGNSATWSQTTAAAQQLYQATNGSVDYMKAISSTMTNSFRNSQVVDERTGQTVDKSVFAQATAGAGTPQISPVKANIEGGASWRVTTSDGKSYVVNQSAEEARSMATNVGETHRTTLSTVRSGQYSETAQKALSQMESVQGSTTASETAAISYSRANEMREAQGQAHSRAADVSANLSRDFYRYVGEKQFGGGAEGDREAIKHLEGLAASGQTKELDALKAQYLSDHNINVESLGANLTQVKGPDLSKAPDPEAMRAKIEGGTAELKNELASQPNLKATDPTAQVQAQLKTEAGAVNPEEIKAELAAGQKEITDGKSGIERKGTEIKQDYTAGALPLAAKKTVEAASDAATGLQQLLPGGYGSQPQVAVQQPKAPKLEQSGIAVDEMQQPVARPDIEPEPLRQSEIQAFPEKTPQQLAAEVTGAQPQVTAQQPVVKQGIEPEPVRQPQPVPQSAQELAAQITQPTRDRAAQPTTPDTARPQGPDQHKNNKAPNLPVGRI